MNFVGGVAVAQIGIPALAILAVGAGAMAIKWAASTDSLVPVTGSFSDGHLTHQKTTRGGPPDRVQTAFGEARFGYLALDQAKPLPFGYPRGSSRPDSRSGARPVSEHGGDQADSLLTTYQSLAAAEQEQRSPKLAARGGRLVWQV